MTQLVQFEGTTHAFPDDFSGADIAHALHSSSPAPEQSAADSDLSGVAGAAAGGYLRGTPLVGEALYDGTQRAAAFYVSHLQGIPYEEALRRVQGVASDLSSQHPEASTVGELAGSTAPLLALGGTAAGGRLMGLTGGSLPSKIVRGTLFNGGLQLLDAQTRPDPAAAAASAPIAAGIGGAVPVVGRVAGPLVRAVTRGAAAGIGSEIGEGLERAGAGAGSEAAAGAEAMQPRLPGDPLPEPGAPGPQPRPGAPPPPPPPGGGMGGAGAGGPPGGAGGAGAAMVQALAPDERIALQRALERGGADTPEKAEALNAQAHPEQMLGELTPGLQAEMGAIAAPTGAAKNTVEAALTERAKAAPQRLNQLLDETLGPYQDPAVIQRQLRVQQNNTTSPLYKQWNETPVPMTPQLEALVPRLRATGAIAAAAKALAEEGLPATQRLAMSAPAEFGGRMIRVGKTLSSSDMGLGPAEMAAHEAPTARAFDYMKGHLDNRITLAIKNEDGRAVRRYRQLKSELTDAIDNHPNQNVAGVWKQGRQAFTAPQRVMEATDLGRRFFDPRVGIDQLQQRFESASAPEIQGLISGARADAAHRLEGTVAGDAALRRSVSSTEAKQKLAWLVGEERASRFGAAVGKEADFAEAPQAVLGNKFTGASAETRAQAAKNWTPQPSEKIEELHKLIEPKHMVAAEIAGHVLGLPGLATGAIAAGAGFATRQAAKAAEATAARIRNAVAPIMTLKGADRAGALRELMRGRAGSP
jgi:hypothetical protein